MNRLPVDITLPTEKLSACFNNTTATYKFYWLLSILHFVEQGKSIITKKEMFACMISRAWYTLNYYHISFGVWDRLQDAVNKVKQLEHLTIDEDQSIILDVLIKTDKQPVINTLLAFDTNVPHRFLSPWIPSENKEFIYSESAKDEIKAPYLLEKDCIRIHHLWADYFYKNVVIIRDFCYWNLANYLQRRNPSVPDIPGKLIKPAERQGLKLQRREFWDIIFQKQPDIKCIYTKKDLSINTYALEHFVPYNFVSHNLIWNLVPADPLFNSFKGDKLPPPKIYFEAFFGMQMRALRCISDLSPKNKFLDEYMLIIPNLLTATEAEMKKRFEDTILPLITLAHNNGFEFFRLL